MVKGQKSNEKFTCSSVDVIYAITCTRYNKIMKIWNFQEHSSATVTVFSVPCQKCLGVLNCMEHFTIRTRQVIGNGMQKGANCDIV